MGITESYLPGIRSQSKNSILRSEPNALVRIGTSLEGLPLFLSINREYDVETGVLNALGAKNKESIDPNIKNALQTLNESVTTYACTLGIVKVEGAEMYVSEKQINDIMNDTLLCRILGKESPLSMENSSSKSSKKSGLRTSVELVAGVEQGGHDRNAVRREVTGNVHLGVPLSDDASKSPLIVISRKNEPISVKSQLQTESFQVLDAKFQFVFYDTNDQRKYSGNLNTLGELQRQLEKCFNDFQAAHKSSQQSTFNPSSIGSFTITISRNNIAKQILFLAKKLQSYHDRGVIHGDVNPSNTLILPNGTLPFDSFDIKLGSIAFAGTPGWASPDQILRKPVSPATDVYPLGLMLVQLVAGSIFGEEKTFIIPTNVDKTHRIRVVYDGEVFIDDKKLEGLGDGKIVWKNFIERCIDFDARKRPKSAEEFAKELEELIVKHPLPGEVKVSDMVGTLEPVLVDGKVVWSRVLSDKKVSRSFLKRLQY